ncbi:MAG TPA: bifunctional metallophosphatase/5'-nucleotidase [Thermoanaerobaculia bacterium]|nr:bifunctional metallophosphatase/5'-nucleotidase [Thermoanaerobaculia bacterium]
MLEIDEIEGLVALSGRNPDMLDRRAFLSSTVLLLAALVAGCASTQAPPAGGSGSGTAAGSVVEINLLQLNDVYEIGAVEGGKQGGLARVTTLRKRLIAENPNTFTVLAGDFVSPSALGTAKVDGQALAGKQMVAVLNAMGLDLATFGNHEFDLKEDQLLDRLAESRFRWTSANVTRASGGAFPGVSPHAVLTAQGRGGSVRIGVVGVTLASNPVDYASYADSLTAFRREVESLRGQVEVVVGLTHLAFADDQALAEGVAGVALILGGHEHENVRAFRGAGFTPILKADANARSVYVHRLAYDTAHRSLAVDSRLVIVSDEIPEDPEVAKLVASWEEKGFAGFRQLGFEPTARVAVTTVALDGREASVRTRATELTDLIARAFLAEAQGSEMAVYNGGSIRIDDVLPPGPVTQYDVIRILPFGGKILTADIRGNLLARALDQGLASRGQGAFLLTANVSRSGGGWTVGGKPLDPGRTYRIAINDYLAAGKEQGLDFLEPGPDFTVVKDNRDQRMAVIDQLRREYPASR